MNNYELEYYEYKPKKIYLHIGDCAASNKLAYDDRNQYSLDFSLSKIKIDLFKPPALFTNKDKLKTVRRNSMDRKRKTKFSVVTFYLDVQRKLRQIRDISCQFCKKIILTKEQLAIIGSLYALDGLQYDRKAALETYLQSLNFVKYEDKVV